MRDYKTWEEIISTLPEEKQEQVRQNLADLLQECAIKQIQKNAYIVTRISPGK